MTGPSTPGNPIATARSTRGLRQFPHWRLSIAFALIFAIMWFGGLELRGLFIPDEGRYAEIPREMLATGDWVTPRLNDLKYFEKPPLQYWTTAVIFKIFGEDEWTARLWSALTGFLAALALVGTVARLHSARAGWLAGLMLASSWGYFLAGQYVTLDMGLTCFLTCALCTFLLAQQDHVTPTKTHLYMLATWTALGLAVLSKGPIALILPGLAVAGYTLVTRSTTILRRLYPLTGLPLLLIIVAPWFIAVQIRNPEFFHFFFVHEHLERFSTAEHQRLGPWWYFIPIGLLGMMPWTPAVLAAITRAGKRAWIMPAGTFDTEKFLLVWIAVIFLFFSVSQSKLPAYVLPAFPALAWLATLTLMEQKRHLLAYSAAALAAAGAVFLIALGTLPYWENALPPAFQAQEVFYWLRWAAVALLAGSIPIWWLNRQKHLLGAMATAAIVSLTFWHLMFAILYEIDETYSSEQLIEHLAGDQRAFLPDIPFYSIDMFDHSVPFYLKRPITLVEYKGELAPGIAAEPEKYIKSLAAFKQRWADDTQAFAIMSPATYQSLRDAQLPMLVVGRDVKRVIVARRPFTPEPVDSTTVR